MCPPGVDQTTRSRQQWHILAPLLRQQYDITDDCARGSYATNLKFFLNGNYTWNAFDKLAVRTLPDAGDVESWMSKLSQTSTHSRPSPIESLPNELFAMIFDDEVLDRSDRIALGLCSTILWRHCLCHVQAAFSKPTWSKTPIICTGTYLDDLPDKIHEIEPSLKRPADSWQAQFHGYGFPGRTGMAPARQWNWKMISESQDTSVDDPDAWISDFDAVAYNKKNDIPLANKKILRQSLGHALSVSKPKPASHWLLRNHDTQEYVCLRGTRNPAMELHLHVKGVSWLSLDKALILRICWSMIQSCYLPLQEKILRGQWAGHRFDVVCADTSNRELCAEEWKDVTAEIVTMAKEWRGRLSSND